MLISSLTALAACDNGNQEETTANETQSETEKPTEQSTTAPTDEPSVAPTSEPTQAPTSEPTQAPTDEPTQTPTDEPTQAPTDEPTQAPTDEPTQTPTEEPTQAPTDEPTQTPTEEPTQTPTEEPTQAPTSEPTQAPTSEPTETPTEDPVTDEIYENGDTLKGAGYQWDEEVFAQNEHNIDESKAVDISAAELIAILKNKESEQLKEGDVYRVTEPIVLESNTKYYGNLAGLIAEGGIVIKDVEEIVVKELIVKGEVKIENSTGITFFRLDIKGGETGLYIDDKSSDIALKNCMIYGTETALKTDADLVSVYCGYFCGNKGIVSTGDNLAVQDTKIEAVTCGIHSTGEGTIIRNNGITLASDGIGVELVKGTTNALVALNVIENAQVSVKVTEGLNCVVLLNSAISVVGENNVNLYVVENKLGGAIVLNNNKYLLCDGNTFSKDGKAHPITNNENTEFNGNNLHDTNARLEYGADEDLLPHTNKDLFLEFTREDGKVIMERHGKVRDVSLTKSYTFNNYVRTMGRKSNIVIVPPGAYSVSDQLNIDSSHSNTTFYAYGVYQEKDSLEILLWISGCSNVTVKGLTVGYTHQSSGQVYVLDKIRKGGKMYLQVVTNAGYINDFGASDPGVFSTGFCDAFAEDAVTPWLSGMSYKYVEKYDDGTMLFQFTGTTQQFGTIGVGDVFACRLAGDNSRSVNVAGSNNKLKDFVLYGYSAALAIVSSGRGTVNCGIERLHNTVHSAPVIEKETYEWYKSLEEQYGADLEVYIDDLGRYRGGLPRVGSVDATHITHAQQGFSATSCLFESMCDDGSNQRGGSSRLAGYKISEDGKTATLYFKGTLSETYWGIHKRDHYTETTPTNTTVPKAGDRILVYASNGHIAFEGTALSDAKKVTEYPGCHVAHIDVNGDCICDDETCKAHVHCDVGTMQAPNRDGVCDKCGTKVYIDMNRNMQCDIWSAAPIADEDGDGYNDSDNVPIIWDETQNEVFTSTTGTLNYYVYYKDGSGAHLIKYTTYIQEVEVDASLLDVSAFEGYDFTDNDYHMNQKILFDNLSMNSAGFVFDNVLIQNTRSRGILVKTVDATIKNCTFRDHGMTAVLLSVETTWGESTVPQNILIQSCLFDNTGCLEGKETNMTLAPIAIQGLGDLSNSVEITKETLPCKNVQIIGNKFINTNNNYCITMSAAQNITIRDNVFTARPEDTDRKFGRAIYINGCMGINISGNHYESEFFKDDITEAVIGWNYKELSGTDVVTKNENGETVYLLPEEKGPMS